MEQRITIGIDPSISCTGIAIFEGKVLVRYGTIKTKPAQSIGERLRFIYSSLENLHQATHIYIGMETPFLGKNIQSFQKLCYIQALIYLWCERSNYSIQTFSPMEVKLAVAGKGNATKEEVAHRVTLMYPSLKGVSLDVTDAVAIALCAGANLHR